MGFTTPGVCALGLGKKSIYVTPYQYHYNSIFSAGQFFIAHNAEELRTALQEEKPLSRALLKGIDAFADGQAKQRLYDLCANFTKS
jgi:hypothetical protein